MQLQERVDQINRLREATGRLRNSMYATMESGGYLDAVARRGGELERVAQFLELFNEPISPLTVDDIVSPGFISTPAPWLFPMFLGLEHKPFHPTENFPWVPEFEATFAALKNEAAASLATFPTSPYGDVTQAGGKWLQGQATSAGSLHDGNIGPVLPVLSSTVKELPGCCAAELATGDCYYSVLESGASINAHTSSDNLKIRFHLGLNIPTGQCAISVGGVTRGWKEGKVLILEDAYPHMAWNRTNEDRIVVLIDFWHPDLTEPERAALTAAFKRSEMREMVLYARSVPDDLTMKLMRAFDAEDDEPYIAEYWPRKPDHVFLRQGRITD